MTTNTSIINRALQKIGTRTTITAAELAAQSSNEAIQAALIYAKLRDQLLRMAPWDCAMNYRNLTYITSAPGTPENATAGTATWQKGQPPPPWLYEYQYPVDCLRACFVVPQFQTGIDGGIPITTAVTGGAAQLWNGPPVQFKVVIDQFYPVTAAAVVAGGTGYAIGDIITLADTPVSTAPIGAPAQLLVATVAAGVILTATVVNQILGATDGDTDDVGAQGGSYFAKQTNPVAASSVAGVGGGTSAGIGATFNLTYGAQSSQRVIVTNQENALLAYCKQITDPNLMDPLFQDAWVSILGGRLTMALTGDKALANMLTVEANNVIIEARKADGNEGLTVDDHTPDWIRVRGVGWDNGWTVGGTSFDWGPLWATF